eukprot:595507-Prorocentrum_minimum.AAC.1
MGEKGQRLLGDDSRPQLLVAHVPQIHLHRPHCSRVVHRPTHVVERGAQPSYHRIYRAIREPQRAATRPDPPIERHHSWPPDTRARGSRVHDRLARDIRVYEESDHVVRGARLRRRPSPGNRAKNTTNRRHVPHFWR